MRRHHQYIAVPKVSSDFIISENLQLHVARILEDISGCISSFHETVMARGLSFFFFHQEYMTRGLMTRGLMAVCTLCTILQSRLLAILRKANSTPHRLSRIDL